MNGFPKVSKFWDPEALNNVRTPGRKKYENPEKPRLRGPHRNIYLSNTYFGCMDRGLNKTKDKISLKNYLKILNPIFY